MKELIVYTLNANGALGFFPECVVVFVDDKGQLSPNFIRISTQNSINYEHLFDERDTVLFNICAKLEKETILSKINDKKVKSWDALTDRYFGNKITKDQQYIKQYIQDYIELYQNQFFENLSDKSLYIPQGRFPFTWQKITVDEEMPELLYCFDNQPDWIYYSLEITHHNKPLSLLTGHFISRKPARIVLRNRLYEFDDEIDGSKLLPFLSKEKVSIAQANAEEYIQKVIAPLVVSNRVIASGFEIKSVSEITSIYLKVREIESTRQFSLFDEADVASDSARNLVFELIFEYDDFKFWAGENGRTTSVSTYESGFCIFYVERSRQLEQLYIDSLKETGLDLDAKIRKMPYTEGIDWINEHFKAIEMAGIEIRIENKTNTDRKIFVGSRSISIELVENRDWFDIKGMVMFGDYEIPFLTILKYIRQNKNTLMLPNGEYAQIPAAWFDEYRTLIDFSKIEDGQAVIAKHHCMVIKGLEQDERIRLSVKDNMRYLFENHTGKEFDLPAGFRGELRPYQREGYNWMRLLDELSLGGCLADDMGLGKTIQTLCLLQSMKEQNRGTNLLVVPTSLVYNWEMEAAKFCPELKVYAHRGPNRTRNYEEIGKPDVLITSYAILRKDRALFSNMLFNYVILDEAQAIKNAQSNTTEACLSLKARRFLTLTGTPLENSISDLWSQVHFFNRNMLGTMSHFMQNCKSPEKLELYSYLLKPFLLRRNKTEVLTDLPEKTIITQWCDMNEPQREFYRETRNTYRDKFLGSTSTDDRVNTMVLLEGLLRLRQTANHPVLVDTAYAGDSGKFDMVCQMLEDVIAQGDKILVFSSFVEHLKLYRNYLDEQAIPYCYLDGSTADRQAEVERFQQDDTYRVFLLSLKAGGVGLNLTKASYVFLLDPWWNPAAEAQAYDRAHRIGQENNVFVYKFITRNTIEEKILKLQEEKLKLFDSVINADIDILKNLNLKDVMSLIE